MTRSEIDEAMKEIVRDTTVDLMDFGGTLPNITAETVLENFPELTEAFGVDRLDALCKEVLESTDPGESRRLQELFQIYNAKYFGEQLRHYTVLAVYDVCHWDGNLGGEVASGFTDLAQSCIFIGITKRRASLPSLLLHHMAHAITGTSDDDDKKWIAEMFRLEALGAPLSDPCLVSSQPTAVRTN